MPHQVKPYFTALLLAISGLPLFAPPASADQVICEAGSGAGQCSSPRAVAVDREDGLLYVSDRANNRIDVFEADGTFLRAFGWDVIPTGAPGDTGPGLETCTATTTCRAGSSGSGAGQFGANFGQGTGLSSIAVNNDPASPAFHDVYVFDETNNRVQRFHPNGEFVLTFGKGVNVGTSGNADVCTAAGPPTDVCGAGSQGFEAGQFNRVTQLALGPSGFVYVADYPQTGSFGEFHNRVQKFAASGAYVSQPLLIEDPQREDHMVVDSAGDFYLGLSAGGGVRKYDPAGNLLSTRPSSNIHALALDAADNLFESKFESGGSAAHSIYEYDSGGSPLRVFYGSGDLQSPPISLAPYTSPGGDVFAAEESEAKRVLYVSFPPPGPVVLPKAAQAGESFPNFKDTYAEPVGNTKATLNARINPEGKETKYHFEYVDDARFQASGFAEAKRVPPSAGEDPVAGSDFGPHLASLAIGCSEPTEALIAAGKCLTPKTVYHFRAVAANADSLPEERKGPEGTFETKGPFEFLATWASEVGTDAAQLHAQVNPLGIPTHGHFEYVDDAQFKASGFAEASESEEFDFGAKEEAITRAVQLFSLEPGTTYRYRIAVADPFAAGAGPEFIFATFPAPAEAKDACANKALRVGASAPLPDCRAYEMVSPVDKGGGEIKVQATGDLDAPAELTQSAAAVPAQGKGLAYSSNRAFGDAISAPYTSQYIASRGAAGWSSHGISPPREGATFDYSTELDTQYEAFAADLGWGLLHSDSEPPLAAGAQPGISNLYRRDNATDSYEAICPAKVSELLSGGAYAPNPQGFTPDGGLIVFQANAKLTKNASGTAAKQLYGCEGGQLRLLSVGTDGKANPGSSNAGSRLSGGFRELNVHNALSADGARVYWAAYLDKADAGLGRLFLRENPFGAGKECSGAAAPCTVAVSEAVGAPGADQGAQFWTASPDGSTAIFSFGQGPLEGNLYEFDAQAETASLIAEGVSGQAGWSEDARRIYLVSTKALAPGAQEGKPNLYLHEAGAGGGFELVAAFPEGTGLGVCAIDNPEPVFRCTRATPDGRRLAFMSRARLSPYDNTDASSPEPCGAPKGLCDAEVYLYDSQANGGVGQLRCVSCNPSGGRPAGRGLRARSTLIPAPIAALIPSWESGFYPLRPLSANGKRLFFESFDALLPRDTNGAEDVYQWEEAQSQAQCDQIGAELYVESAGGCLSLISSGRSPRDSEFVDASADGSDVFFKTTESLLPQDPGLIDIYDARVGGGFPPEPGQPAACEGEACQGSLEAPNDPTPASSAFQGAGNVAGPTSKPCRKGKVKRKGRCVAKQHKRAKRANHNRRAPG